MTEDIQGMAGDRGPARGEDTRQRLIEAALDLFGRWGFDGASTRALADAAGVNIAAISYHFGSKDGLYRAVTEHLVATITERVGAPAVAAASVAADPDAPREALLEAFLGIVERFVTTLVPDGPAERWARFIVREQMDPSPNFEILFARLLQPVHGALTRLLARLKGLPPESEEARLLVFMLIGQVIVFRAARATVMRGMGWDTVGAPELAVVRKLLRRQTLAALALEASSC